MALALPSGPTQGDHSVRESIDRADFDLAESPSGRLLPEGDFGLREEGPAACLPSVCGGGDQAVKIATEGLRYIRSAPRRR